MSWIPESRPRRPDFSDAPLGRHLPEQSLNLPPGEGGDDLPERLQPASGGGAVSNMLEQQFLVGLPVQPPLASVNALLAGQNVVLAGEDVSRRFASAKRFHDAFFKECLDAEEDCRRNRLFPVNHVQSQEVLNAERLLAGDGIGLIKTVRRWSSPETPDPALG